MSDTVRRLREKAEAAHQSLVEWPPGSTEREIAFNAMRAEADYDTLMALCDLADAGDEHFRVELTHERSSSFDRCTRCGCQWPCPTERIRAALARLDGEDTG